MKMADIERVPLLDRTLSMAADPYGFISKTCRRLGTDAFETRFLLEKTVCMRGSDAAALLYDRDRFVRRGAMPGAVQKTLLGQGGVQGLDGDHHRHRKALIMDLMSPSRIDHLVGMFEDQWRHAAAAWSLRREIVLYEELHPILARAACEWAGVPLGAREDRRVRDLRALFDGAGSLGPGHLRSRLARRRADTWIAGIVRDIREGRHAPPVGSAAHAIAWHRDLDGKLLPETIAAVEILNVVRPIVAISVYITFVAHALHTQPDARDALSAGDADDLDLFVQEVRRFYPFFPAVAARVRMPFDRDGLHFPKDRLVLLDLHGTNHDEARWINADRFEPERFRKGCPSPLDMIPQGGGDHRLDHRCAGEWITIAIMKAATKILAHQMRYRVPKQDLRIDHSKLPALPRSGLVLKEVAMSTRAQQGE